jgi:hypothetical protein
MASVREPELVQVVRDVDGWRPEIEDLVRFAYRRRPVGWPELYDELCLVAARGTFRGLGYAELAELGLTFSLCELPGLARLAVHVAEEEREANGGVPPAPERPPVVMEIRRRHMVPMASRPRPQSSPRLTVVRGASV